MCNSAMKPLIVRFKNQDMTAFPLIYENFRKLIYLYASRLGFEDAVSDLTLFLIELLYQIDLTRFRADCSYGLKKYIAVCLRNKYIALAVNKKKIINFAADYFENANGDYELYDEKIIMRDAFMCLKPKQRRVLVYRYIYGYSDCEIALKLNITRQSVNRIKNRALAVLREFLKDI